GEEAGLFRPQNFFSSIRLLHAVALSGLRSEVGTSDFIAMQKRAKEGSTKANMHTFQLAAEDYGVQNDGTYAAAATSLEPMLPQRSEERRVGKEARSRSRPPHENNRARAGPEVPTPTRA